MFTKVCLFVALVATLVSALKVQVPENPTSGGPVILRWTSETGDPDTWSFFLFNDVFHSSYAIANNVDPAPQQLSLTLPAVPVGTGYTLVATNIGNVTDTYGSSSTFSIGATSSGSLSSTATSSVSLPSVSPRSTTSIQSSLIVTRSSISGTTPSSTTDTSSVPTAGTSSSAAPRRLDFKIGGFAAAALAIGGATILAL